MTIFWIMTGLATALAGLVVLAGARRGAEAEAVVDSQSASRELAELDRLKARGLLDETAWVAARAEAGRRMLAARRQARTPVVGRHDRVWVLGTIIACALASLGLYGVLGSPGHEDQAFDVRVSQWAAEPEALGPAQMAAVMGRVVRDNPDSHQALALLGAARFEAGDPVGAASAFRRALALKPGDAQSWARLGESLVRANEGTVGADAELAFARALELDVDQLGARYFLGEAALQRGEIDRARQLWTPLMAALDPADSRRAELAARLQTVPAAGPAAGAGQ